MPGGGPILINLVHEIDSLRVMCGEIESVQAVASHSVRHHAVEDTVAVTMRFASGALGTFVLSDAAASGLSWEQTSGEDRAYARYREQDCYIVAGTQGSLGIPTLRLSLAKGPPSWHEPMQTRRLVARNADPLVRQLEHFCDVIRGHVQPLVPARDAVRTLRVTQAVVEAARSGDTVWCGPGNGTGTLLDRPSGGS
jgi:predicted dehydrogenase